jgi:hypothetical protein
LTASKLTFADAEKVREVARRGEAMDTSEARQMLEYGIEVGRGGLYLKLTLEQHAKVEATRSPLSSREGPLKPDVAALR